MGFETQSDKPAAAVPDQRLLHVLLRRLRWRAHWSLKPGRPLVVDPWWDGMSLELPHSGSAATAYYRTFPSGEIARWMSELLGPGMTVVDVGAHVGVYSMLAARLVGPEGAVHAIEPQGECAILVDRNRNRNQLANLTTHTLALADEDGDVDLSVDTRTMGGFAGSSVGGPTTRVPARTLGTFAEQQRLGNIDLLKLDAAGNEPTVLRGAVDLLGGRIGCVICKLYHPDVMAERFGAEGGPTETVDLLRASGYDVQLAGGRRAGALELEREFAEGEYTIPALATRPRASRS